MLRFKVGNIFVAAWLTLRTCSAGHAKTWRSVGNRRGWHFEALYQSGVELRQGKKKYKSTTRNTHTHTQLRRAHLRQSPPWPKPSRGLTASSNPRALTSVHPPTPPLHPANTHLYTDRPQSALLPLRCSRRLSAARRRHRRRGRCYS